MYFPQQVCKTFLPLKEKQNLENITEFWKLVKSFRKLLKYKNYKIISLVTENDNEKLQICDPDNNLIKKSPLELGFLAHKHMTLDVLPQIHSVTEKDDCSICMEKIKKRDTHALLCCHKFHPKCIIRWLLTKNTCPLCRSPVKVSMGVNYQPTHDQYEELRIYVQTSNFIRIGNASSILHYSV